MLLGYVLLSVCDGCKDVMDTDQDGASFTPFHAMEHPLALAHPTIAPRKKVRGACL